ncbi:16S rRNA (cytosine(1402)-N(4))-methyltransferase RsmH [Corynebacterium sp. P7202]|uniref:Ribosomal RNA small subunit methyltransferase H n=1 Tax=Corynebacterium pygosceleis TaxID=2800406 RepID=A0A9Q4C6M6_9CORY|nr:16S rRNA (cytosine(1402)-N(4))-methyltransferase RsmH [Corynebacterium pygosceleis]MCK7636641.1 16S rRNA (cytosine(1402)-N(4))-methyltransferase RsmH [Corynebacterium pygosceleis]MCX7444121.1 16S rRNA (cytosine(1402)-N(4))-methyltransferase RsmH [Corynebacterium pygosceleis]MCX7467394.1 16S rRNA (cytosine(1402)-N(4))-methyltransferase RsmH [Corynebacterium pygosceleis]
MKTMTGNGGHGHVPVLRERVTDLLRPAILDAGPGAVIIDGTLGAGGHSEYFLTVFPEVRVIGLDRDPIALEQARGRLERFGDRFRGLHTRFDRFVSAVETDDSEPCLLMREHGVAGALFDLGVSSMQLDQADRGFAYSQDAPLDMRMDPTSGITAADILNTYGHGELAHVLKAYGDERFAGKIASAVLREREKEPFTTSGRLVELLYATIPAAARRTGGHPAKRTFQALRVEVNGELESVAAMVPAITRELRVGGRAVFMAYQSLEDRIVKKELAELTTSKTPRGLPVDLPGTAPEFRLVTRGAEKAPREEIEDNPRAAPVRVRAVERTTQSNGETR